MSKLPRSYRVLFRHLFFKTSTNNSFLELPKEIRTLIYHSIAPDAFLPGVPHVAYIGLLYSCQQICREMAFESLRAMPYILDRLQEAQLAEAIKAPPRFPVNAFCHITNVQTELPFTALFSTAEQLSKLAWLEPLLKLHLTSFTITLQSTISSETPTYYQVAPFAARINCLLAPRLCLLDHYKTHKCCVRRLASDPTINTAHLETLQQTVCNVRIVRLHFPQLNAAQTLTRWVLAKGPTREKNEMRQHGWDIQERVVRGEGSPHEVEITWKKIEDGARGRYKKIGGLLKGLGKHKAGR
ncbi:hypothetical protein C7974DRAFT_85478 [Boeremia exigua]|uniref:uncharacterized protein n=1 Tax=Boeremia exigua TaxID=749465 RepID=UPI001E8D9FAD|nr:uncharacterized protein C7974DRAFT_85478 [Boeremia exigua]KAH6611832.1 hypothetical protein C7974DRAFT_85478 [Boeremia exigua]